MAETIDNVKLELGEEKNPQEGSTNPSDKDKDIVKLALKRFDAFTNYHKDNIDNADKNNKVAVLGDMWPEKIKAAREKDGLPCLTFNRAPGFIGRHVGNMLKNLPRPKAVGVDSKSDPELGRIITELGRKVRRQSQAEDIYSNVIKQTLTSGYTSWRRLTTDYVDDSSFEQEIYIEWIPFQKSVMLDPLAIKMDTPGRGGPKWGAVAEDLIPAEFARRYPKATVKSIENVGETERITGYMDKENVRIVEYFYAEPFNVNVSQFEVPQLDGAGLVVGKSIITLEEGTPKHQALIAQYPGIKPVKTRKSERYKIMRCVISAYEILEPATEWLGKYIPIIPCYPKTSWTDGKQVMEGLYQWAIPAGQMRNYWASALTSNVALSEAPPYVATAKMIANNQTTWENPKGLRVITYTPDPQAPAAKPTRESPAVISQGEVTMLQLAIDEEKALASTYDASLGNKSNETSGVAIQSRDAQSTDTQYEYYNELKKSLRYEEMQLIDLYPKVYDTPRIFRIYGEDGRDQGEMPVNQPTGEFEQDETGKLVEKLLNDLSIMRYDVDVQVGPGPESKRQESAQILSQLSNGNPALQAIVTPSVMRSLDFEESDTVAEMAESILPPQALEILKAKRNKRKQDPAMQGQEQMAQMQQQAKQMLEQVRGEAAQEIQKVDAENEQLKAQLANKERELALKEQELQVRMQTEQIKAQASVEVATIDAQKEIAIAQMTPPEKEPQEQESMGGMKGMGMGGHGMTMIVDSQGQARDAIEQGTALTIQAIEQMSAGLAQGIGMIAEKLAEKPERSTTEKVGVVIAPNGQRYEMRMTEQERSAD